MRFDRECRYLLHNQKSAVAVDRNQIQIEHEKTKVGSINGQRRLFFPLSLSSQRVRVDAGLLPLEMKSI